MPHMSNCLMSCQHDGGDVTGDLCVSQHTHHHDHTPACRRPIKLVTHVTTQIYTLTQCTRQVCKLHVAPCRMQYAYCNTPCCNTPLLLHLGLCILCFAFTDSRHCVHLGTHTFDSCGPLDCPVLRRRASHTHVCFLHTFTLQKHDCQLPRSMDTVHFNWICVIDAKQTFTPLDPAIFRTKSFVAP